MENTELEKERKKAVIPALRRASRWWKYKNEALKDSKSGPNRYRCKRCGQLFGQSDIALDHIAPVIPVEGWDGWDAFIKRLFCDKKAYQVLCKPHHTEKTNKENLERRRNKKRAKQK